MVNVMPDGLPVIELRLQDNLVINTNIFNAVKFQYLYNASPFKHNRKKLFVCFD